MAVDIRRSTDLMLKANPPENFARFINAVCIRLKSIIVNNHGVFDKFTGDGVIAYFPRFYTGEVAGYCAVLAASECLGMFQQYYEENKRLFTAAFADAGLGIGIDFGDTHLVHMGTETIIVGSPVVYACRLSDGKAGQILVNQAAYDDLLTRFRSSLKFESIVFEMKHEGPFLVHEVKLQRSETVTPKWSEYTDDSTPTMD